MYISRLYPASNTTFWRITQFWTSINVLFCKTFPFPINQIKMMKSIKKKHLKKVHLICVFYIQILLTIKIYKMESLDLVATWSLVPHNFRCCTDSLGNPDVLRTKVFKVKKNSVLIFLHHIQRNHIWHILLILKLKIILVYTYSHSLLSMRSDLITETKKKNYDAQFLNQSQWLFP